MVAEATDKPSLSASQSAGEGQVEDGLLRGGQTPATKQG